jgi:hypothetical protein
LVLALAPFWACGLLFAQETTAADRPLPQNLHAVKRLCVEEFDGGENARQLRALLIAEFHRLGAFVLTENPDKADAYVRGFGEDLIYTEQHSREENTGARGAIGISTGGYTRNRASATQSVGGNTAVRERLETRRHEASLSVRIVNADGDVLWTATAESRGGKFRSAGADVAEKLAKALKVSLASDNPAPQESAENPR